MNNWQHIGLIVKPLNDNEGSCKEISNAMEQTIPNFHKLYINLRGCEINREKLCESLTTKLLKQSGKKLMGIIGHGMYHHLTYGLCKYADSISKKYSYIHLDHHPDSFITPEERALRLLNCNNFVPPILEDTNAQNVLYLGSEKIEEEFYGGIRTAKYEKSGSMRENVSGFFKVEKLERLIDSLEDDVYISMDLDVMNPQEIVTDYNRGYLTKKGLFDVLAMIKRTKRIIGADIVGYSNSLEDVKNVLKKDSCPGVPMIVLFNLAINSLIPTGTEEIPLKEEDIQKLKEKSFQLYRDIAKFTTK